MKLCLDCVKRMKDYIVDHPVCCLFLTFSSCDICNQTSNIIHIEESQLLCKDAWFDLARIKSKEKK